MSDHVEIDALLEDIFKSFGNSGSTEIFRKLDYFWARLAMHIRAEHLHIFPALIAFHNAHGPVGKRGEQLADVSSEIARLRDDHDFFMHELAEAIKAMSAITTENEARTIRDVQRRIQALALRLDDHNQREEQKIYPIISMLTVPGESGKLEASVKHELENPPPRFRVPKDEET